MLVTFKFIPVKFQTGLFRRLPSIRGTRKRGQKRQHSNPRMHIRRLIRSRGEIQKPLDNQRSTLGEPTNERQMHAANTL